MCLFVTLSLHYSRDDMYLWRHHIFSDQHNEGKRRKREGGKKIFECIQFRAKAISKMLKCNMVSKQQKNMITLLKRLIPYYIHVSTLINLDSPIKLSQIIRKQFSFCLRVH